MSDNWSYRQPAPRGPQAGRHIEGAEARCYIPDMPSNRYYSGPSSDHFDGRFFNLAPATPDKAVAEVRRWRRNARPQPWPDSVAVAPAAPPPRSAATRITLVGHATVLIQTRNLNLLTDPFWSKRASPVPFFGPKRICPPAVAFDALPKIDAVLLSHNHYDHCDTSTLRRLAKRDSPLFIAPLGNDRVLKRSGATRMQTRDWWEDCDLGAEVRVAVVPAQHWSSRGLHDRRMALWGGFVVHAGEEKIYFAGDTGYGDGSLFKTIRDRVGAPDLALLPIGAYDPRWFMADQHINPEEAVMIFEDISAKQALAIHWGVIQLTDESRDAPREDLLTALSVRGIPPEKFVAEEPGFIWEA
ncbi:L-ascorbate metabolism protein UlaG (beta-lactamase superfamily) [Rhodoblastus acidophilus]|uniref:MBL fold metallo-hydrolase n=1 Tax=Rhodoblastus acidophilus TaxID=1074 RepID=UPI002224B8A1|nr:MBL fold metallo-hydrolase [Rhodoblastus acidophilus]MCW2283022.1 L-ascorbate metabolism protein UlaG (beta-lactamase superfamily) [Rhodoblastus acidophilus]MCW2331927.1 L-ascorbate metabolism protein UlaG (beta-lactamase superfamily) [Rhodoblastus acidophilus]